MGHTKIQQTMMLVKGKIIYKAIEVSCLINLHFPSNLNFSFRGMLLNVATSLVSECKLRLEKVVIDEIQLGKNTR